MPDDRTGGKPSLMRNLEAFFRNIADELEDDTRPVAPAEAPTDGKSREVGRRVQEVRRGDYVFRRTTIDEVIFDPEKPGSRGEPPCP
jgi:hypothetical protein